MLCKITGAGCGGCSSCRPLTDVPEEVGVAKMARPAAEVVDDEVPVEHTCSSQGTDGEDSSDACAGGDAHVTSGGTASEEGAYTGQGGCDVL